MVLVIWYTENLWFWWKNWERIAGFWAVVTIMIIVIVIIILRMVVLYHKQFSELLAEQL
jgi:hypothetical protein